MEKKVQNIFKIAKLHSQFHDCNEICYDNIIARLAELDLPPEEYHKHCKDLAEILEVS